MHFVDWAIVAGVVSFFIGMAWFTNRFAKSVADFMAANRCAGRYVLAVGYGISSLGAITVIAEFQKYYKAGFTAVWWSFMLAVGVLVAVTGWVIYRYRQTRVFTLGQFFEIRYSKRFRIFAGILGFLAGIINFGIFPSVGSRFFIYFCGFPETVHVFGLTVSTFALVMFILLSVSLFFTFAGGQISVIVTDFLQGLFCNIVFIVILVILFMEFNWNDIITGLKMAPLHQSRINPFDTSAIPDFNMWYFLIGVFMMFYGVLAWQGQQGYFCSAKNAHEQQMAAILSNWRLVALGLLLVLLSVSAFVVLHNPKYGAVAAKVRATLNTIDNKQIQEQLRVPLVLVNVLPKGIVGLFCAVMLAAFISTHDTYFHTWGTIFIQDVILPFRKKPFSPKVHMLLLRLSILGVAIFVFCWSLFFRQTQDIFMYFQISGAIFVSGVGAVIIGGLYWKRGTTAGAWSAMIVGSITSAAGLILIHIHNITPFTNPVLAYIGSKTGAVLSFWTAVLSIVVYVTVSLLTCKEPFNLDRMLHRGKYAIKEEQVAEKLPVTGWRAILGTEEFTFWDKVISASVVIWSFGWFGVFLAGVGYNLIYGISEYWWEHFWKYYTWICFIVGSGVTIWFAIGGLRDLKIMFRTLASAKRNLEDNGMVIDHHSRGEEISE